MPFKTGSIGTHTPTFIICTNPNDGAETVIKQLIITNYFSAKSPYYK